MTSRILTARSRRIALVAAVALVVPLALSQQGLAKGSRQAVTHGANGQRVSGGGYKPEPRMYRLKHGAGEPTLGFTKGGTVFVTASDGCVTSCPGSEESLSTVAPGGRVVLASADKGKTWEDRTPGVSPVSPHVISMDPYMFVDTTTDGSRVMDIDLTVACAELSYSDDEGTTWITNPIACGEPVNDHQTLFAGVPVSSPTVAYPKILYYCFNHPAFTKCSKSLNGGLTFIPTAQITPPECSGINGHGVTDAKGVIYIPLASACAAPMLAISRDEGDTWEMVRVAKDRAAGLDPSVAVDAAGNLYYIYVEGEDLLPKLATSRDGGKSWSTPVVVSPPGVRRTNLATIDVGKPGNVAIAYYGSTVDSDRQADWRWNGYIASGVGVLGPKPVFYTGSINNPIEPLKARGCGPGRCGRVLDFIDVEIAPDGSPWGAYVDACAAECEKTGVESIHDNEGIVGTLVQGPKLL